MFVKMVIKVLVLIADDERIEINKLVGKINHDKEFSA